MIPTPRRNHVTRLKYAYSILFVFCKKGASTLLANFKERRNAAVPRRTEALLHPGAGQAQIGRGCRHCSSRESSGRWTGLALREPTNDRCQVGGLTWEVIRFPSYKTQTSGKLLNSKCAVSSARDRIEISSRRSRKMIGAGPKSSDKHFTDDQQRNNSILLRVIHNVPCRTYVQLVHLSYTHYCAYT